MAERAWRSRVGQCRGATQAVVGREADTKRGEGVLGAPAGKLAKIVASPDAIWLATTGKDNRAVVPDPLKLAVEHDSLKPARTAGAASRKVSPFRLTLHTREMIVSGVEVNAVAHEEQNVRPAKGEAAEKVRQAKLEQEEKAQREQQIIQTIFQEKGDAIHAELRPTATGFKLTVQLEEAFLAMFGRMMASELDDSPEENE